MQQRKNDEEKHEGYIRHGINAFYHLSSPTAQIDALTKKARQGNGVSIGRVGIFGVTKPVAVISYPFPSTKLAKLINDLDEQDNSRAPYANFQRSTTGFSDNHSFMLTLSGKDTARVMRERKDFIMQKFKQEELFKLTKIALDKRIRSTSIINAREILTVVSEVFAKILFNIDVLPANTADIITRAAELADNTLYALFPITANCNPSIYLSRRAYTAFIEEIKRTNPQAEIAHDSLLAIFIAARSLAKQIISGLANFTDYELQTGYYHEFRSVIHKMHGRSDDLSSKVLEDPYLHGFYLEMLRLYPAIVGIIRHTRAEIKDLNIPANTFISVALPSYGIQENDSEFCNPARYSEGKEKAHHLAFSTGRRSCPAEGIAAPVIFKTCLAFFAQRYHITLVNNQYNLSPLTHLVVSDRRFRDRPLSTWNLFMPAEIFIDPAEYYRQEINLDCYRVSINIGVTWDTQDIIIGRNHEELFRQLKGNIYFAKMILLKMLDQFPLQLEVKQLDRLISNLEDIQKASKSEYFPIISEAKRRAELLFQDQLVLTFAPNASSRLYILNCLEKHLKAAGVPPSSRPYGHMQINNYASTKKTEANKKAYADLKTTVTQTPMTLFNLNLEPGINIYSIIRSCLEKMITITPAYKDKLNAFSNIIAGIETDDAITLNQGLGKLYNIETHVLITQYIPNWFNMNRFQKLQTITQEFFHEVDFNPLSKSSTLPPFLASFCFTLNRFFDNTTGLLDDADTLIHFNQFLEHHLNAKKQSATTALSRKVS